MNDPNTAPTGAPGPPPRPARSSALAGRERVRPDRPEWAAGAIPAHRRPLPLITREAVGRPDARATDDRLAALGRERHVGEWSPRMAELRERGAAIRRETLRDLDGHLRRLTRRVEENGGVVHRVGTAEEAAAVIERIAAENDVELVVKSKSMATEEIHLNARLEGRGVDVVETDLGEYIVQLADERPAHIIAPAVHKSRAQVTDLFGRLAGEPMSSDAAELATFARERLRGDFRAAGMGVSGVNFAAADTGTLVLVTNEGNADMVTSQPRVHVAVMPVEKVIPRFRDLGVLIPLLCDTATKQRASVYQTMLTGPRRDGEADGPDQLHLVIFDNGRTDVLGTPQEEVLACIRCGNCQIACPVYRTVGGGHAYAAVYGGPIGAVLSPIIGDRDRDADLPFLSSLCGACFDACPVKIPIPDLLVNLRAEYERRHGRWSGLFWRLWSYAWRGARGYRFTMAAARLAGRLVPAPLLARLPGPGRRWARGRTLPPLGAAGAFRAWYARRDTAAAGLAGPLGDDAEPDRPGKAAEPAGPATSPGATTPRATTDDTPGTPGHGTAPGAAMRVAPDAAPGGAPAVPEGGTAAGSAMHDASDAVPGGAPDGAAAVPGDGTAADDAMRVAPGVTLGGAPDDAAVKAGGGTAAGDALHGGPDVAPGDTTPGKIADDSPAALAALFAERLAEAGGTAHVAASRAEARELVRRVVAGRSALVQDDPVLAGLDTGGDAADDPWQAEVGVTTALGAAADTGTLALGAAPGSPRRTSILPGVHVAVVPLSRLVATYADLIDRVDALRPKPSGMQFVTGPSRSGDIEMAMIQGMHGPREVHVVLCPDAP